VVGNDILDTVTDSKPRAIYWGLAAILLLAAGLRLYRIEHQNVWLDEAFSAYMVQKGFLMLIASATSDIHPPLYYLSLKCWVALFGLSPTALRSLSALFSLTLIWLSFLLARKLMTDRAALLVALLLALSSHQIYHAQEARMYALVAVLTLAMTLCYCRLREQAMAQPRYLVAFFISATLALYTHYVALLLIGAINAHFLYALLAERKTSGARLWGREVKRWLLLQLGVVALFSPWLLVITQQLKNSPPMSWRTPATLSEALLAAGWFPLKLIVCWVYPWDLPYAVQKQFQNPRDWTNFYFLSQQFLLVVVGFGVVGLLFLRSLMARQKQPLALVLWLFPLAVATVVGLRGTLELPRYLMPTAPYFFILLSSGLMQLKRAGLRLFSLLALIVVMTIGVIGYAHKPARDSDYRPVVQTIQTEFKPGDVILPVPYYISHVLRYYLRQTQLTPAVFASFEYYSIPDYLQEKRVNRAWVVLDYRSRLFSKPGSELIPLSDFRLVEEHTFATDRPMIRLLLVERLPTR
jgi:uncharacterized membrane protein